MFDIKDFKTAQKLLGRKSLQVPIQQSKAISKDLPTVPAMGRKSLQKLRRESTKWKKVVPTFDPTLRGFRVRSVAPPTNRTYQQIRKVLDIEPKAEAYHMEIRPSSNVHIKIPTCQIERPASADSPGIHSKMQQTQFKCNSGRQTFDQRTSEILDLNPWQVSESDGFEDLF